MNMSAPCFCRSVSGFEILSDCLGERSNTRLGFWIGGCAGGVSGADSGVWFGDAIPQMSFVNNKWFQDVHAQFNCIIIDINTIIHLNSPSSRQIASSQDFNPMLRLIVAKFRSRLKDEYVQLGTVQLEQRLSQAPETGLKPVLRLAQHRQPCHGPRLVPKTQF